MGFGSWNCTNSQSEDPYALETDDDDDCLTRLKRKHKSGIKQKKVFKNSSSQSLVDCTPQEKHVCGSSLHLSQDFAPQINRSTIYKHNNRIKVSEKPYRFFKSRNTFLLSGENLKSGIHSKCISQECTNVEYSSETHCLSDTENEENEKSSTREDAALLPNNSFIKQNITNSLTATKGTPKEENIFSSILRILPRTNSEEAIPALSEDNTLNLRSIKQFHCQNSQMPSQTAKPFMFQRNKKILHKQQKETLAKSNKFFKSRNRNAISKCNLGYFTINNCAYQDKESLNAEKCMPGNFFHTNTKSVSDDPYSLETEDDSYSYKQNKQFKYVNTENISIYQDKNCKEMCSLGNNPQSNYPYVLEMNGDLATTINKNVKCMAKQNNVKNSNEQFSTEVAHFHTVQSADAAKTKILHTPGKQKFINSKMKAVNQPSIGNITSQSKQENYFPIVNTSANKTFHPTNESTEILSLPKSSEKSSNLCGKRRHQIEISHLSSSLIHEEKDVKSPVTAISSKKCSIAYTYVIKNTLSVVTQKRNSLEDSNIDSIHKGKYGTYLTSGNINCKKENISNKETSKITHEINVNVSPVIRNLAKLDIHPNLSKKRITRATNVADNNEESHLMPDNYTACNKTVTVKPALETKELGAPELNSTYLDINDLKSPKQTQSSCVSFTKNIDSEIEISHSENVQNDLITDQLVSESVTNEIENHFKKTTEDFQFSYSSQQKDTPKMLRNTSTDQIEITKSCQNTRAISLHEKKKLETQIKTKNNTEGENLIKIQVNTFPTDIETTEKETGSKTDCSVKQVVNVVNKKTFLPIMKRGSSFKKCIFTSQRKRSAFLYAHKWVDDIEGDKNTKLKSPKGLLVQPVEIINSDHEIKEQSPLLCVTNKHIQTTEFTNNAEAVIDLKSNEKDKYFTVIKNVRKSDKIQELGEVQEFNDDVEYILDALQDSNPITTRCHSALILASKCLVPEFRMHVKAYDTMSKFSCALHDAAEDQSLALCTATIMFVLSHYEIITHMSSSSIYLLLNLLNSCLKKEAESVQLQSIKNKVLEICAEVQSQGFVKHQLHENMTAYHLASETLLNLTSCDTGYLFEDRLREMGGLKHIIMAIINCRTETDGFFIQWRGDLIDKLRFLNCCLQILESATDQNEENQLYVLKYKSGCFMETMAALLSKCTGEIKNVYQFNCTDGVVILEVLFTILKVLINLTHSNNNTSFGSSLVARSPEIIHASLRVLLQAPSYIPEDKKFDLLALVLMFLINTVECNTCNRKLIFEARASDIMIHNSNNERTVKVLIELFYQQEKLARIEEFKTNAMLDDQIESELSTEPLEPSQEFIATLQEKAGQNMEYTMIASYIVLLIGYLIVDNEEYEIYIRQCLPLRSFSTMISVLEKMCNFLNMVPAISSKKDITQTEHIIQCLKQSDEKATEATSNIY